MRVLENGKYRDMTDEEINDLQKTFISYAQARLNELKELLSNTDYIACKIAEGSATKEEYTDIIAQRQEWRKEINEIEKSEN